MHAERRALLGGLLLAAAALVTPAVHAAPGFDLDALMGLLAATKSGQARFSEQRHVKGLDAPLSSSGTLSFSAPDRFVRSTTSPKAETVAVEGNFLTTTRNGRSRTMVLDASPELEAIVEAVRGTLTGNAASLRQHFKPQVSGNAEQWTLDLMPQTPRLQFLLERIRLQGRRAELRTVEMRMGDGDSSVMTIEALVLSNAPTASAGKP